MQDRICQIDETLLQRTAGPYIRSGSALMTTRRPLFAENRTDGTDQVYRLRDQP